jgi:hypothetical protein
VRAVILCPGPSLLASLRDLNSGVLDASFVIGVNRAVTAYSCDYWCSLDAETYEETAPIGTPKIVCGNGNYRRLHRRRPDYPLGAARLYTDEVDKNNGVPDSIKWRSYSFLTAIMFAYEQGAREILIAGADLCGHRDWDNGQDARVNRSEERWIKERRYYEDFSRWLSERGVTIRRVKNGFEAEYIHFVWFGRPMPKWAKRNIDRFRELNPAKKIMVHDDSVLMEKYSPIYANIKDNSSKSDLIRYSVLQRFGGWYFDVDFYPFRPLAEAERAWGITGERLFCAWQRTKLVSINDAVLFARPRCKAWTWLDALVFSRKHPYKLLAFGPNLLMDLSDEHMDAMQVVDCPFWYPLGPDAASDAYALSVITKNDDHMREAHHGTGGQLPFAMHLWAHNYERHLI